MKQVRLKVDVLPALFHSLKIKKSSLMNINLIGFAKTGHIGIQDISATQTSSQKPLATTMSTSEAGKIKGGCFASIVSFFEN